MEISSASNLNQSFGLSEATAEAIKRRQDAPVPKATDEVQLPSQPKQDELVITQELHNNGPKIGFWRCFFNRLTQEQIDEINRTGELPKGNKFKTPYGAWSNGISRNFFNLSQGTRKLKPGYIVRKNKLGFTRVVPEGTDGFWIRRKEDKKAKNN